MAFEVSEEIKCTCKDCNLKFKITSWQLQRNDGDVKCPDCGSFEVDCDYLPEV